MSTTFEYNSSFNFSGNSSYADYFDDATGCSNMDCIWDRERKKRIFSLRSLTVLLSLIGIIGIVGNTFVILVFSRRSHMKTSTYLVLMLGIIDLIACCLVIPGTLYREWLYDFRYDSICKLSELMRNFVIVSSALTLTAIAFDRFWLIYKKTTQTRNLKITLVMVFIIVMTGISLGVPPMLGVGIYMESDDLNNFMNIKACITNDILISDEGLLVYWKVITALFGFLILTIIILYLSIFTIVYKHTNDNKGRNCAGKTSVTSLCTNRQKKTMSILPLPSTSETINVIYLEKKKNKTSLRNALKNNTSIVFAKIRALFRRSREGADDVITIQVIGNSTTSLKSSQKEQYLNANLLQAHRSQEPQPGPSGQQKSSAANTRGQQKSSAANTSGQQKTSAANTSGQQKSFAANTSGQQMTSAANTDNKIPFQCKNGYKTSGRIGQKSQSTSPCGNGNNSRHQSLPSRQHGAHVKTTQVLCIITTVYITAFLPMFLITHGVIKQNAIVFYLYFINNAANPIIYSFMNRNFRLDIWKMFQYKRNNILPR